MNKINYDQVLEDLIKQNLRNGTRPSLVLHACCAPCASVAIERLKDAFNLVVYFYNPNIDGLEEYEYRKTECKRLCEHFGVKFIYENHQKDNFLSSVVGLENEPERGARCEVCFNIRLKKTYQKAREIKADYFATTLTLSPLKNAELINRIGEKIDEGETRYLPTDFKKRGGNIRSIELSKQLNLYRQNYCGCEFSKRKKENV